MASLSTQLGDWPCLVANVSGGGSMIACAAKLGIGEDVVLKLNNGRRLSGTVAWQSEGRLGLAFHSPKPLPDLLASDGISGHRRRLPRFAAACAAEIATEGRLRTAQVLDVSEGGVKIEAPDAVVGARVKVALPGLSALHGQIRWARGGEAGIAFEERLPFETLSKWYAENRTELGRAAGRFLGALAAMLASPAAAAQGPRSSVQTHGSAEILDHVGVTIKGSQTDPQKQASSPSSSITGSVVSTSTTTSTNGGAPVASGTDGSVIHQYN